MVDAERNTKMGGRKRTFVPSAGFLLFIVALLRISRSRQDFLPVHNLRSILNYAPGSQKGAKF